MSNDEDDEAYSEDMRIPGDPLLRGASPEPIPRATLAEITGEVGGGVYNWKKFKGHGSKTGQATELNGSTGITNGTRVVLHRAEGVYYFFFPIETCA